MIGYNLQMSYLQDFVLNTNKDFLHVSLSVCLTLWRPNWPKRARLSILLCLTPEYFTLSNARGFYSSMGNPWESMG